MHLKCVVHQQFCNSEIMAVSSVSPPSHLVLAAVIIILVVYVRSLVRWRSRTRGRSLPPGPNGLPFFGNVLDLRKGRPWIGFNELRKKHGRSTFSVSRTAVSDLNIIAGPILYLEAFRQPIVVLGSPEAVLEYLDRRSANTSDRKQTPSIAL